MECRVCFMPEPGNHYKENCCRPCAAFFRRTVQLKISYKCKRLKDCKVTRENRYFCKYCRLKRCIAVGMTDPEDPTFPIEIFLDDTPNEDMVTLPSIEDEDIFSSNSFFNNHDDFQRKLAGKVYSTLQKNPKASKYPFSLSLCQQAVKAYIQHEQKWPNRTRVQIIYSDVFDFNEIMRNMYKEYLQIAEFCMELDQFSSLSFCQKKILLERFSNRFIHLDSLFQTVDILGTDLNDTRTVYHNGQVADCRQIEMDVSKMNNGTEDDLKSLLHAMEDDYVNVCLMQFKRVNPDRFELMYLLISNLFNVEGVSSNISSETIEKGNFVREQLSDELYMYYQFDKKIENPASRIYKLHNLINCLDRTQEQIAESTKLAETFNLMKISVF